jgi:threonine synthase
MEFITHLQCAKCGKKVNYDSVWNTCPVCGKPFVVLYDLKKIKKTLKKEDLKNRESTIWRYHELLPVLEPGNRLCLGEGFTPLIHARRLGQTLGFPELYIKDESFNPTGSFKARGMAVAISRAKELGIKHVSVPSLGNAGTALSAYAAMAGMKSYVFMPKDVPRAFIVQCVALGAKVELVEGMITDCSRVAEQEAREAGRFDLSTLKEPYRVEGKKTMGFELAEQLNWELPDVIIYPTGSGTGLIGMWKAFEEMENLGWVKNKRPRMVSVQSDGCAPIVRSFYENKDFAEPWQNAQTIADGLRVPATIGDFIILRTLRESRGTAVTVSDSEIMECLQLIGTTQGIFSCPEGAATLAAFRRLREQNWIKDREKVVLFNTATGLNYLHLWFKTP